MATRARRQARYPLARSSPSQVNNGRSPARHPNDVELHNFLEGHLRGLRDGLRPTNTQNAMDGKEKEYSQFCAKVYYREQYPCHMTYEKVYRFMWFQSSRAQKLRGGDKRAIRNGIYFDYEEYKKVVPVFDGDPESVAFYPTPQKPIGKTTFAM
jgi:hypothetical protein